MHGEGGIYFMLHVENKLCVEISVDEAKEVTKGFVSCAGYTRLCNGLCHLWVVG